MVGVVSWFGWLVWLLFLVGKGVTDGSIDGFRRGQGG